jgi:protein-arginine kinase activator protein McsA
MAWALQQFRPQLLMVHTRARAAESLATNDYPAAIQQIEEGLTQIKDFYREHPRGDSPEPSNEVSFLKTWLEEIAAQRPLSKREKLEQALNEAVTNEDYEKAAQMRDALRNLKPTE